MARNFRTDRLAAVIAAGLMFALGGCVADTPHTQLDWFPAGDPAPRHVRVADVPTPDPKPAPPRHLRPRPVQVAALDCPPAKPKPGHPAWYTNTANPPPPPGTPQNVVFNPPAAGGAFAWPVNGPVVADYGSTNNGGRNDGINIAVPYGTPIHAAAAGQVSYAGNELRGYGNLVLIKHDDGYVTAYAHAERIVVGRGDVVQKGQIIGYAGQTGDVTSPQLHFEIRKGVTPVNPRTMLASNRAS